MNTLLQLYKSYTGAESAKIETIKAGGSTRSYYRFIAVDGSTLIGAVGKDAEENCAFVYLSHHLATKNISVPKVLAVSNDHLCYLQTDLGNQSLFDAFADARSEGGKYSSEQAEWLENVMKHLPILQVKGAENLDWSKCYPQSSFDVTNVMFDLHYFKYCFLKLMPLEFNELKLEQDFNCLASLLTQETLQGFMYRDFQARNIMIDSHKNLSFIDFQGGRKGPYYYDLASFLWQASALYNDELREKLIAVYYETLGTYVALPNFNTFRDKLNLFVLFRLLQVLGAYGFRGYMQGKAHFIQSIPPAMSNLRKILQETSVLKECTYLKELLDRLVNLDLFKVKNSVEKSETPTFKVHDEQEENPKKLIVEVYSFSYHRGIPADLSGNGGGYVFDCRAVHNPGRYQPYKKLTGLDYPVIKFLEEDGEILTFLKSVYQLADAHVERYLERGFTHLMFSFGCTGGQHRSVYSAQHVAEHLHRKYGVEVHLTHREQNINKVFTAK